MLKIETKNFRRISKQAAKKRYYMNQPVIMVPCKVNPENDYIGSRPLTLESCSGATFERVLNEFTFYNCNYSELGKYAAYYEPVWVQAVPHQYKE